MRNLVAAGAAATFLLAGCGNSGPATFPVTGDVMGMVAKPADIVEGKSCQYLDAKLTAGDTVVIKGSDGSILGKAELSPGKQEYAVCQMNFGFPKIKAGEPAYTVEVEGYGPIVATEDELRSDPFRLRARYALEAMTKKPLQIDKG